MRSVFLAVFLLGSVHATGVQGGPFPITESLLWHYESTFQNQVESSERFFEGSLDIGGTTARTLHFVGGPDDGLEQHWSQDVTGDVFLHGFDVPDVAVRHIPPLLWIDLPLVVGKSWDTETMSPSGPLLLHFEVLRFEPIMVPAGTFQCFTIEWSMPIPLTPKIAPSDVVGQRKMMSGQQGTLQSYSEETGLIETILGPGRTDRLQSVEERVAVTPATWTGIRQLYR